MSSAGIRVVPSARARCWLPVWRPNCLPPPQYGGHHAGAPQLACSLPTAGVLEEALSEAPERLSMMAAAKRAPKAATSSSSFCRRPMGEYEYSTCTASSSRPAGHW